MAQLGFELIFPMSRESSMQDAINKAHELCKNYYKDRSYELVSLETEASMTIGGQVIGYSCTVRAIAV